MKTIISLSLIFSFLYSPLSIAISDLADRVITETTDKSNSPTPTNNSREEIEEDKEWSDEFKFVSIFIQHYRSFVILRIFVPRRDIYQAPYLEQITRPPRS